MDHDGIHGNGSTADTQLSRPRSRYYIQKMRATENSSRSSGSSNTENVIAADSDTVSKGKMLDAVNITNAVESRQSSNHDSSGTTAVQLPRVLVAQSEFTDGPEENTLSERIIFPSSLDKVEPEKLAWMKDLEEPSTVSDNSTPDEKGKLFEARFDMSGNILSPDSSIPVSVGLHHHGQEPEKAGYTLDEILILMQSSAQAQKLWALSIFTAILRKAKSSVYDEYLQDSLLKKMVDENLVLPLRFLLDVDSFPIISAAILALRTFLINEADEYLTDEVLIWDKEPLLFELLPATKRDQQDGEEEKDLPDVQLMRIDVVKGLLRTSLLQRFSYLLRTYGKEMDSAVLINLIEILIRIVRHSQDIAHQVADDEVVMEHVMSSWVTAKAPIVQMQFLRVLCWMVGPVTTRHTERILMSAAGWVARLRNDIKDIITRDMVTESLSLLIVLANCQAVPQNAISVVDVFPQVLFSAGTKSGGNVTAWDARCCSRILSFLSLCLSIEPEGKPVLVDALVVVIIRNVLTGLMELWLKEDVDKKDYLIQLEASYLQFVAAYIRHRRPNYSDISASFSSRLLESLSTVLVITKIIKRKQVNMSEVDPDSLPSYGVVARGGNAVHPVFKDAKMINLLTQYTRCLRFCPKKMLQRKTAVEDINRLLKQITYYNQQVEEFWAYYYVRPLIEIVLLAWEMFEADCAINGQYLYCAGLHLVPFLCQHNETELGIILTKIVFNVDLQRKTVWDDPKSLVVTETMARLSPENMQAVSQVFQDLRPLGLFRQRHQSSLVLPSRDASVFTRNWIFECYSYIVAWAKTEGIRKSLSSDSCVHGYFEWLVIIVRALMKCGSLVISPAEVYTSLGIYFTEEDANYRDVSVGLCLQAILALIMTNSSHPVQLKVSEKVNGKPLEDFYNSILDDYVASSYGDLTFTMYILIPVCQSQDFAYRKLFWGPEKQVWPVIRIHHLDLCYAVQLHLEPQEEDPNLLSQYYRLLVTQSITEKRNPLLFLIAIHHLNNLLLKPVADSTLKFRNRLIQILSGNPQNVYAQQILRYKAPSSDRLTAIDLYESVPEPLNVLLNPLS